ncbi:uncharacterized protein MONBRDRAFT_25144 [Monosiga brevicollis MX1]|uniref:BolA-like protein 3 n=1 Tax=Monosiga brevicollis TaxID=81824 RepID=A9UYJ3_MONBE|nr:uncharacterized protein MONBRDRAFT_25144 [Monosiga brevicollis MX1]EDQ89471.1 predicted protein [Monosiga brevicollis MX1]|eukprot:XP_001745500.1 hypothetical protein [Monosiga brevicollis MX1]
MLRRLVGPLAQSARATRLGARNLHASGAWHSSQAEEDMAAKLREAFNTDQVTVQDDSGGCGAQYMVVVESEAFRGLSRLKQNRLVTGVLREEISQMHAIRVFTRVPEPSDTSA